MKNELTKIWWLWAPISFIFVQIWLERYSAPESLSALMSENGPHELFQFFIIFVAAIISVDILCLKPWKVAPWFLIWVFFAAGACIYIAGEEISWGQQFLKWQTPDFWQSVNDQHETNLHNTSSWFDQKPRLILMIGTVIGAIIIPFLRKYKPGHVPEKFAIIYPPATLALLSVLLVGTNILNHIDGHIMARSSETEELFLFYFMLLYMVVLRGRVLQLPS